MARAYGSPFFYNALFLDGLKSIPTKLTEPTALKLCVCSFQTSTASSVGTAHLVTTDFNPLDNKLHQKAQVP
jgi:hypothetical protein